MYFVIHLKKSELKRKTDRRKHEENNSYYQVTLLIENDG